MSNDGKGSFLDFECAKCHSIIQFAIPNKFDYSCPNCQNPTLVPFVSEHEEHSKQLALLQSKIRFLTTHGKSLKEAVDVLTKRIDKAEKVLRHLDERLVDLECDTPEDQVWN